MAIVVYPSMHEIAHALVAWAVGAEVKAVHVFSEPQVLCDLRNVNDVGTVLIGWSGCVLPLVFSLLLRPRHFWIWYAVFVLRGISVFACALAEVSVWMFVCGRPMTNDDITQLLQLCPQSLWISFCLAAVLFAIGTVALVHDKPFDRCAAYFAEGRKEVP